MNKHRIGFMLYLVPANFVLDMIGFYFETGGITALSRGVVFVLFLITIIFVPFKSSPNIHYTSNVFKSILRILFIILIYWLFLILFSSNKFNSIREYSRILVILLTLPSSIIMGSHYKSTNFFFRQLNNSCVLLLLLATLNIIVANIFKLNQIAYSDTVSFYTGGLHINVWYVLPLSILYILGYRVIYLRSKTLLYENILIVLSILWLMLSWRRTAFIILGLGLLLLLYFSKTNIKLILKGTVIGLVAFFLVGNTFLSIYEDRKETIDKGLEGETRVLETEWVFEKVFSFDDWYTSIFGREIFNTPGNYLDGIYKERPIHVDINIILWGSGLLGLSLYVFFHLIILRLYKNNINTLNLAGNESRFIRFIFHYFYLTTLVVSFSGGFQAITFRSFLYIIIGGCLGQLIMLSYKRNDEYN